MPDYYAKGRNIDYALSKHLDPNIAYRSALLPIGKTKSGELALAAPEAALSLARSLMLPGHVARGGAYSQQDVTNMALDVGSIGAPIGMATAPAGGIAMGASGVKSNPMIRLYRGLEKKYEKNYNMSKSDAPIGYSTWTDNPELARQYAGKKGFVYYIDVPKSSMGKELIDQHGDRALYVNNKKPAGLNNISGDEYLLYHGHDDFFDSLIKEFNGN